MKSIPLFQEYGSGEVSRTLAEVLARPEFQPPPPSPIRDLLVRIFDWMGARLADLVEWLFPNLGAVAGPVFNQVAVAVLVVVGLVLLVRLGRMALEAYRGRGEEAGADGGEHARPPTATDWELRAKRAAEAGRWREAAVALYHAVVHRLADRGKVRLDPSKTPGDYRREVKDDPALSSAMKSFVRSFEPVAFGPGSPDARSYRRLRTVAETLGVRG